MQRPFIGTRNLPSAANPDNPAPILCQREAVNADDHPKVSNAQSSVKCVKDNSHNHPPLPLELRVIAEAIHGRTRHTFYDNGRDFIRGKALCQHGEWLLFVEASGFSARSAQAQMQAARAIDAGEVPPALTLDATLAAVAKSADSAHLPAPADPVAKLIRCQAECAEARADMEHWQQRTAAMQLENRRLERIARRHGLIDGKGRTVADA